MTILVAQAGNASKTLPSSDPTQDAETMDKVIVTAIFVIGGVAAALVAVAGIWSVSSEGGQAVAASSYQRSDEVKTEVEIIATAGFPGSSTALDAVSAVDETGGCDPCNFSHTVSSGLSRTIIVVVATWNPGSGQSINSITYAGDALTEVRTDANGTKSKTSIWYRVNPQSGSPGTVSIDFSESTQGVFGAYSLSGVHQTAPIETHNGGTGLSSTATVDLTTVTDGVNLIDGVWVDSSLTVGPGQVQRFDVCLGALPCGDSSTEATITSGVHTMSWSLSASKDWAISAAALSPTKPSVALWVKNVGVIDVPAIERSDVFLETDTGLQRMVYNASGGANTWQYIMAGSGWERDETVKILITPALLNPGAHFAHFVTSNGESDKEVVQVYP